MKKTIKIVSNFMWGFLILLILLIGFSTLPIPGNYKLYSVMSGSMEPDIRRGSVMVVKPVDSYEENDVITYNISGSKDTITHRIIKKETIEEQVIFTTKGDANDAEDREPISSDDIVGKALYQIPLLGYPMSFTKTKEGLIFLVIIPATIIIYSEILNIKKEVKKKVQYKKAIKKRKENKDKNEEEKK